MLATVEVPETAHAIYSDAVIRKALASVTFRPAPMQERLGLLPFKFDEMAGFRVLQVLPAGGVHPDRRADRRHHPAALHGRFRSAPTRRASQRSRPLCPRFASTAPLATSRFNSRSRCASPAARLRGPRPGRGPARDAGRSGAMASLQRHRLFAHYRRHRKRDNWDALFTRFRAVRDGITFINNNGRPQLGAGRRLDSRTNA